MMEGVKSGNRLDSHALIVAVAIDGDAKSKYIVRWALEKFASEEHVVFKLLHAIAKITTLPTARVSDSYSQAREDAIDAYKKEIEWDTNEMLLPYKTMFIQKEVQVDVLVIEADDVARAIAEAVNKHRINKLVIGAPSSSIFTRKPKKYTDNLSSRISTCAPRFCTVYVVSKGKLISIRPSEVWTNERIKVDTSDKSWSAKKQTTCSSSAPTGIGSLASHSRFNHSSLPFQRFHALSAMNQTLFNAQTSPINITSNGRMSLDRNSLDSMSESSGWRSLETDNQMFFSYQDSYSAGFSDSFSSESRGNYDFEMEKLRNELKHAQKMYAMAQTENVDASQKLNDLNQRVLEEATKLKRLKLKEVETKELAAEEKEKHEAARKEAEHVGESVEREASQRREAEKRDEEKAKEKERLNNALVGPLQQYVKFTWEEIEAATSSLSEDLKIGRGAFGTVYKCNLHHTTVAVKVLHPDRSNMTKQFEQELEVLSKIRHPHLLLLLGACPERGCLIYEYMENGNLEERLRRANNTPPLPWFERYRIAWEIASALNFLQSTKPKPIVHRDLKPANILLDHNLVSKIGDVGLSKVVNLDPSYVSTLFNETGPVGTFFYICPEYQRTGLVSPQSDVYSFGVIILQLLTAKQPAALSHLVETAVEYGNLVEILDADAGDWPMEETRELALLGLKCTEIRRQDRPDMKGELLPALERLKAVADRARNSSSRTQAAPPSHLICPISKDVMIDPCVAADGYSYDRKSIEDWLEKHDTSPVTNLPLPSKTLLPNHALLSAITEWKTQ